MKLQTTILKTGGNTAGIVVPDEIVDSARRGQTAEGAGDDQRATPGEPALPRWTAGSWVGVSAEVRSAAGVAGGDEVDLELEVDDAPREVEVPTDFAAALAANPTEKARFEKLSYSHQRRHVMAIEAAKAAETRARRIEGALKILREG